MNKNNKKNQAFTGGALNELNGKLGISSPDRSVPVMKLIRLHNPKSKDELVALIKFHYENICTCGVKSKGTIEHFGKKLYDAQIKYWGGFRFSLSECIQWEYDLFILQSLKGNLIEKKAMQILQHELPVYVVEKAIGYLDEELRIDILVKFGRKEKCGIQVKPHTFLKIRNEVILFSKKANARWGNPVFYLFYDNEEKFINMANVVVGVKGILT